MLFEILDVCERVSVYEEHFVLIYGEFDPGSERTLAECFMHASRARKLPSGGE